MTYEQMTNAANANFNRLASTHKNANKNIFDTFPLEVRIVMTKEFFIQYCI